MLSLSTRPGLAARIGDAPPSCTLWWIQGQLGRADMSEARFVAYVQGLVDGHGFPPPFPSMVKGSKARQGGLTNAVTRHSTFRRDAVEAWLADFLPPAGEAALDAEAQARAAAEMDAAAGQLGTLRLVRGGRA